MVFVVEHDAGVRRRRPARRPARPLIATCASTSSRSSPSTSTAPLRRVAARPGARARAARRAGARPARRTDRPCTARVDDAPFGGGAGHGDDARSRCSPRSRPSQPPRPLLLLSAGGRRFDQASRARARRAATASRCCAGATRASTSGSPTTSCDGELSVGDYVLAGGEAAALVVIEAVARLVPGRDGQRGVGRRRVVRRRPARVPAVHPAGRVPGLGRCPRCCARATTPGSPAGGGRRRCAARSRAAPTCSTPGAAHRRGARAAGASSRTIRRPSG